MPVIPPFPTLQITEEVPKVFVRLQGQAGQGQMEQLERYFQSLIARKPRLVLIDMSDLCGVSSKCLVNLVKLQRELDRIGGKVVLIDAPPEVAEVFKSVGLADIFEME